MPTNKDIINHLNIILKNELTAINQYFLHAKMLKHFGFHKLADYEYRESIDEMKHAEALTERILFLEGLPNLQDLGKLMIGETVLEMLKSDLDMELRSSIDLKNACADAEAAKDFVTMDMLEKILHSEEEHIDFLRQQLSLIEKVGIENYLQTQI